MKVKNKEVVIYLKRLEKLAARKTSEACQAAEEEAMLFRQQLDKVTNLSDEGSFAEGLNSLINRLILNEKTIHFSPRTPATIRQALVQFLQLRRHFPYDVWEPVSEPDKSAPDESNVFAARKAYARAVDFDECDNRDQDLCDLLRMFGRLARNIRSSFLPRIIQLITDMKDACRWNKSISEQEASRLVDDFIACWKLVMTETELLDPEELLEIWPKRPTHEAQNEYSSIDAIGLDAEEATDASRERAWEIYCRELKDIMLPANASKGSAHPLSYLASFITDIADEMERGEPSTDARWSKLDYDTLSRVLSANTLFTFDGYEIEDEGMESEGTYCQSMVEVCCEEPTPENNYKKQIIKDLDRYLDAACLLAKKIGSKSYDDFAECQARFAAHNGDFRGYLDRDKLIAAKDLNIFISRLKRARPVLWVDNANYDPKLSDTQTAFNALKAHVSSETDRGIAAKAPKRVRKFGHEGNGLKGPKTRTMKEQKRAFDAFLKEHPEGPGHSRISRAHECWLKHPEWIKAAKATGEAKGYANHKSLAAAK